MKIMNHSIITILIFSCSFWVQAKPHTKSISGKLRHPIFHFIINLRPSINKQLAMKYSNSFHRYSKRYGLDPYLLVAIAMQESGIVLNRIRMVKGYVYVDKKYVPMKIETDFCMMQIHYRNVENMGLDLKKLITDYDYCIGVGAKILAYFRRYENSEENWWTRYNTSNSLKRKIYENLVNRYYDLRP